MEYRKEPINGHPEYMIDTDGNVYNKNGSIKKLNKNKNGYLYACLAEGGEKYSLRVHRLVALQFIPNDEPDNKTFVNHKDGDRTNNNVDNLEWSTPQENILHAINILGTFTQTQPRKRNICRLDRYTGELLHQFNTMASAAEFISKTEGTKPESASTCIRRVLSGEREYYKNLKWIEEPEYMGV